MSLQRSRSALFIVGLFLVAGCTTAYSLPPVAITHPAHPQAMSTPPPAPSDTLAYGPSDTPPAQAASPMAQQHAKNGMPMSEPEGKHLVMGQGTVIAVVPSSNQLVVDHGPIKGFMDAMTMGYRVQPPALLQGLNAGDAIHFVIDTEQKAIVKIMKVKP